MIKYLIILIVAISAGLLFYRLPELMSFFSDQAWFYISARDMVLTGNIPLVGIASSHPWLHQGALWTYILGLIFAVSQFNPIAPVYFTAGVGVITVLLVYIIGKKMFSSAVGLVSTFLYATSPLIIIHARTPYHTSFIPLTALLYMFALYKWITGNIYYFPAVIFLIALLYNFQISTTPFSLVAFIILGFGLWKKKDFAIKLLNKKVIGLSFLAWIIPMLPMLIYDFQNGFPQTLKVVVWVGYRFALLFGFPSIHGDKVFEPLAPFIPFTLTKIQQLIFLPNDFISLAILIIAVVVVSFSLYRKFQKKIFDKGLIILYLCFFIPFVSYLALKTTSEAYWPMFFPTIILVLAVAIVSFMRTNLSKVLLSFMILLWGVLNAWTLVQNNYLMNTRDFGYSFEERLTAAKIITAKSNGREYNIQGLGNGSKFESFIMPYTYLTWWLGKAPSQGKEKLIYTVTEKPDQIEVSERQLK